MAQDNLQRIPGNGSNDVWMTTRGRFPAMISVKPDRIVLRWLGHHVGQPATAGTARDLLADLAARLGC